MSNLIDTSSLSAQPSESLLFSVRINWPILSNIKVTYREYYRSKVYAQDIYRRFPQWVDGFERVIWTQGVWNEWVVERGFEGGVEDG